MNYIDTVKSMMMLYPSIFKTRLDCDNHLFATNGNGYEWKNGELVCPDISAVPSTKEAIKKIVNYRLVDNFHIRYTVAQAVAFLDNNLTDKDSVPFSVCMEVAQKFAANSAKDINEEIEQVYNVDENYYKYEPGVSKTVYPICEYAKMNSIPSDINPDWAVGLRNFISMCLSNRELWLYNDGFLEKQVEYLKTARTKLDEIISSRRQIEFDDYEFSQENLLDICHGDVTDRDVEYCHKVKRDKEVNGFDGYNYLIKEIESDESDVTPNSYVVFTNILHKNNETTEEIVQVSDFFLKEELWCKDGHEPIILDGFYEEPKDLTLKIEFDGLSYTEDELLDICHGHGAKEDQRLILKDKQEDISNYDLVGFSYTLVNIKTLNHYKIFTEFSLYNKLPEKIVQIVDIQYKNNLYLKKD